jgi:hypothetical protein
MANVIGPHGFTPIRNNGMYSGQTNIYFIPATDTNQYNIGDAVKSVVGGDPAGIPSVTKSTGAAAEFQRGVIVGVLPVQAVGTPSLVGVPLALEVINIPATKTRGYYVEVNDDPNTLYQIQDDGLNVLTATACNKNASFTVANNTNAQIQISATVLTTASVAVTANLPLKMRGLYQQVAPGSGNQFGANAIWVVQFNLHELSSSGVAGV